MDETDGLVATAKKKHTYGPQRETAKSRALFARYAAMGRERSLRRLAEEINAEAIKAGKRDSFKSKFNYVTILSFRFHWQDRVAEYDSERALERQQRREARWERMNDRHYDEAEEAMSLAMQEIRRLAANEQFGSQAAGQLLKIATDIQRMAIESERNEEKAKDPGQIKIVILTDGEVKSPKQIEMPIIDATVVEQ